MKIPGSIRALHESLQDELRFLEDYTDEKLRRFVSARRWFYESRVKSVESFALKVETGRVESPAAMEDLFGATIVVQNHSQVDSAVELLQSEVGLSVVYRRPENSRVTKKLSSSFQFDDLRLYVRHPQPAGIRPRVELDRVFEIQVKTLLQHAWGTATHDAIYKAPVVSWGRERVGFQARAILEHVENAIAVLDSYENVISFPAYPPYSLQNDVLSLISAKWPPDRLPADTRRLAANVADVLNVLGVSVPQLQAALDAAFAKGEGPASLNISPYQAVLTSLFDAHAAKFLALTPQKTRLRFCITPELFVSNPGLTSISAELIVTV